MSTPQPGIFAQGTRSQYHLEFDLKAGAKPKDIADAVGTLREPLVTAGGTNMVIGFRADVWRSIAPNDTPADAHDFAGVEGDGVACQIGETQVDVHPISHPVGIGLGREAGFPAKLRGQLAMDPRRSPEII